MNAREDLAAKFRAAILATIERVPVSIAPDGANAHSIVDNGTANALGDRRCEARFCDGEGRRPNGQALAFQPTFWVRFKQ